MTIETIPLFVLAAYGLAWTVGQSHLSLGVRIWLASNQKTAANFLLTLLECPGCFGFWEGTIGAFVLHQPLSPIWGFAIMTTNLFLDALIDRKQASTTFDFPGLLVGPPIQGVEHGRSEDVQ